MSKFPFILTILAALSVMKSAPAQDWQIAKGPLMTRWAKDVSPANALPEYPRPSLVRDKWQNLNGLWSYSVTNKNVENAPTQYDGQILVPYPIESALSGVMKKFQPNQRLWYRRTFTLPKDWDGQRVLLHFGAVDWESKIILNGQTLGEHRGGYDDFSFNIAKQLKPGENELIVSVVDPTETGWQSFGKQKLVSNDYNYMPTSGIWQTVWLEPVTKSYVDNLNIRTDATKGRVEIDVNARTAAGETALQVSLLDGEKTVATATGKLGRPYTNLFYNSPQAKGVSSYETTKLAFDVKSPHLWTPDDPFLYNVKVELKDTVTGAILDSVTSYTGIRTITVGHDANGITRPFLNGKPVLFSGLLDQGFWPDGVYTAPTDEALRFDIEAQKKLGMNAVRKHLKIEPERWYYWADKLGLMVLQDMPAAKSSDPAEDVSSNPVVAEANEWEMHKIIKQHWNHPSIVMWIMFNETNGQFDTIRIADETKQLDPSRLVDEVSGYALHGGGDVVDTHGPTPLREPNRISIISESNNYGLLAPGHQWPGNSWAGGTYKGNNRGTPYPIDADAKKWYSDRVAGFYRRMWDQTDQTGVSGVFKVQYTDVEAETNGLLSYDREVWKVDPTIVAPAARGEDSTRKASAIFPTTQTRPVN